MNTLTRIRALARRDLTVELSYHFQLVMRLLSVLIAVMTFYFLGRLVGDPEELSRFDGGYFEFALLGVVVIGLSQAMVLSLVRSIQAAQANGTLEILLSTPTRLPTLMAGTCVVPMLLAAVETIIYLTLGVVLTGFAPPLQGVAIAIVLLCLTLGTFAAIGLFSATIIVLTKRGDPFSGMVLQASYLLGGAVYPVAVLPEWLQTVSHAIPAFYGLHGLREVLLAGMGLETAGRDILILVGFNILLLPLSLVSLAHAIQIARVTGTLGNQ